MRSIDACEEGSWSIVTWKKDGGEEPAVMPFRCRSWRHEGDCRRECGACDFVRIREGLERFEAWTYCVFTYPHKEWPDVTKLFRFGLVSWARLRKRFIRQFGNIKYIQTWEKHKSGYPHVNVVISNAIFQKTAAKERNYNFPKFLSPMVEECGFGWKCYAEPIKSAERMAGYITKLGLELTGATVKNQVPVNAPRHFRRIRASRGVLPKRYKNDEVTGMIVRVPADIAAQQLGIEPRKKPAKNRKVI